MKPLPTDILDEYWFKYSKPSNYLDYMPSTAVQLIRQLESPVAGSAFRNQFFALWQIFFEGLIENNSHSESWEEQAEVLAAFYRAGRIFVDSFYRGQGVKVDEIQETILPYADSIVASCRKKEAKRRHVGTIAKRIYQLGLSLPQQPQLASIDTVVAIASGGFEPACLAAEVLDINLILGLRYSAYHRRDTEIMWPDQQSEQEINENFTQKNVLVVEDVCAWGTTLRKAMEFVGSRQPTALYGTFCHADPPCIPSVFLDTKSKKKYSHLIQKNPSFVLLTSQRT